MDTIETQSWHCDSDVSSVASDDLSHHDSHHFNSTGSSTTGHQHQPHEQTDQVPHTDARLAYHEVHHVSAPAELADALSIVSSAPSSIDAASELRLPPATSTPVLAATSHGTPAPALSPAPQPSADQLGLVAPIIEGSPDELARLRHALSRAAQAYHLERHQHATCQQALHATKSRLAAARAKLASTQRSAALAAEQRHYLEFIRHAVTRVAAARGVELQWDISHTDDSAAQALQASAAAELAGMTGTVLAGDHLQRGLQAVPGLAALRGAAADAAIQRAQSAEARADTAQAAALEARDAAAAAVATGQHQAAAMQAHINQLNDELAAAALLHARRARSAEDSIRALQAECKTARAALRRAALQREEARGALSTEQTEHARAQQQLGSLQAVSARLAQQVVHERQARRALAVKLEQLGPEVQALASQAQAWQQVAVGTGPRAGAHALRLHPGDGGAGLPSMADGQLDASAISAATEWMFAGPAFTTGMSRHSVFVDDEQASEKERTLLASMDIPDQQAAQRTADPAHASAMAANLHASASQSTAVHYTAAAANMGVAAAAQLDEAWLRTFDADTRAVLASALQAAEPVSEPPTKRVDGQGHAARPRERSHSSTAASRGELARAKARANIVMQAAAQSVATAYRARDELAVRCSQLSTEVQHWRSTALQLQAAADSPAKRNTASRGAQTEAAALLPMPQPAEAPSSAPIASVASTSQHQTSPPSPLVRPEVSPSTPSTASTSSAGTAGASSVSSALQPAQPALTSGPQPTHRLTAPADAELVNLTAVSVPGLSLAEQSPGSDSLVTGSWCTQAESTDFGSPPRPAGAGLQQWALQAALHQTRLVSDARTAVLQAQLQVEQNRVRVMALRAAKAGMRVGDLWSPDSPSQLSMPALTPGAAKPVPPLALHNVPRAMLGTGQLAAAGHAQPVDDAHRNTSVIGPSPTRYGPGAPSPSSTSCSQQHAELISSPVPASHTPPRVPRLGMASANAPDAAGWSSAPPHEAGSWVELHRATPVRSR